MRRLILANILSSGVEKLFVIAVQFLSSILVIRLLPRDDYGVIGVVAGYFAFVSFINVSLESIMLKEHKAFDEKRKEVLQAFSFSIFSKRSFLSSSPRSLPLSYRAFMKTADSFTPYGRLRLS